MSIALPDDHPAAGPLAQAGIEVRPQGRAMLGLGLDVLVLNLMPNRARTELQLAKMLGASPYQVELTFLLPSARRGAPASGGQRASFYRSWPEVRERTFDGLVITGAPVETQGFAEVPFWPELRDVFDWSTTNVRGTWAICWAAMAALQHFHRVPKHPLPEKRFGVVANQVESETSSLFAGMPDVFWAPTSRRAEVRREDLPEAVEVLARAADGSPSMVEDHMNRVLCTFDHLEYDTLTLADEYWRDRAAGRAVPLPRNYFPHDDPDLLPLNRWQPFARRFARNWLAELFRRRLGIDFARSA